MKKRMLVIGVSMLLCAFGGCLEATPLTEGEMDAAAEYAASLLLRYDENYDMPLYYMDWPEEEDSEAAQAPEDTKKPGEGTTSSGSVESTVAPTPLPDKSKEEGITQQLTEIMDVNNITVSCTGYVPMKSVQSTEYFSLTAKEGRRYIVVYFELQNNTNRDLVFDASEKGLQYSLDINTKTSYKVSLSMLPNDLQYMEIPVPANGTADGVLVFEVADTTYNTIHLIVENNENDTIFVKLK